MLASTAFAGRADKLPRLTLTMALFQDSGWYLPMWDQVPPMEFGQGAGCGIVQRRTEVYTLINPKQNWYCQAAATSEFYGALVP